MKRNISIILLVITILSYMYIPTSAITDITTDNSIVERSMSILRIVNPDIELSEDVSTTITRGHFVNILAAVASKETFPIEALIFEDINNDQELAKSIGFAVSVGAVNTNSPKFYPFDKIFEDVAQNNWFVWYTNYAFTH